MLTVIWRTIENDNGDHCIRFGWGKGGLFGGQVRKKRSTCAPEEDIPPRDGFNCRRCT